MVELTDKEIINIVERYTVDDAKFPNRYKIIALEAQRKLFRKIEERMYNKSPRMIMPEDWNTIKKELEIK